MEEREYGLESGQVAKPPADKESEDPSTLEDHQFRADPEKIKPIEAEDFKVRAVRKSRSGRVFLFEDPTENRPHPGKVLLIKSDKEEIVAVRVLKNYPARFAARVVLKFKEPALNTDYRALKKLGDKIIAMIKERERQGKDLNETQTDEELAKEVAPDDNELDRGIPLPQPKATGKKRTKPVSQPRANNQGPAPLFSKEGLELTSESIEVAEEDEPFADLDVNEETVLEPKNHALSLEYGSFKSVDKVGDPASYSGVGARYSYNAFRNVIFKKKHLQDMITAEAGLFYYTITGFVRADDRVSVFPLALTARYNLLLGETFSFFGYLGLAHNFASSGSAEAGLNETQLVEFNNGMNFLQSTKAAVGVGAMMKIGPSWAIRVEYGTDIFGIGAVLKF